MLQIELARLNAAELHQLSSVARARGQHALARELAAEIAARNTGLGEPIRMRPDWAPAPSAVVRTRRRSLAPYLMSSALALVAVGWAAPLSRDAGPPPPPRVMTARLSADLSTVPPTVEAAATPAPEPPSAPEQAAAPAAAGPAHLAKPNPCYDLPTPGERLICGYPSLAAQDRRLQAAYDRAAAVASDQDALRRDQTAWQAARDKVRDRDELATLYAARINALDAAAGAAPPT